MLSKKIILELSKKWQTTEANVAREYLQHLFLRSFYKFEESKKILFKGGTALKIVYGSPRFSEDLDFSAQTRSYLPIEKLIEETLIDLSLEQKVELEETKRTTGGYLAQISSEISGLLVRIQIEISQRNGRMVEPDSFLVSSPFLPEYLILTFPKYLLITEKIKACLARKKSRDFFDIYFLARKGMLGEFLKDYHKPLLASLNHLDSSLVSKDLKPLLPSSHQILVRSLKENLRSELEKF